ncbi:anhydro-N-acetylmuramic acid kinase [Deinococcus malanensis]|uniref:anhydro-N-acetylmuramic acid kinase n=1 Tax=Deinococcus malanensis TaxID=1706855 RepID=UPI003626BC5A
MSRPARVLGLMSGTSADGIDAALLELPGWPPLGTGGRFPTLPSGTPRGRVVGHHFTPYPPELRTAVLRAMRSEADTAELTSLHWWLGELLAQGAAPWPPTRT